MNEADFWEINEDGSFSYSTKQLEALALCFQHFDLNITLTPETFHTLMYSWANSIIRNNTVWDKEKKRSVAAPEEEWFVCEAELKETMELINKWEEAIRQAKRLLKNVSVR